MMKHYATVIEASLVFCSKNDRSLMKVARDLFSQLAFGTKFRLIAKTSSKEETNNEV